MKNHSIHTIFNEFLFTFQISYIEKLIINYQKKRDNHKYTIISKFLILIFIQGLK